ncbi:polyphosphate polymerase domain-containing protein [Alkalicoccus chagannorensis]|uniref:polyphosphate polymerase domain-containing protein n=1 Tax=Alkalicoccus chagannorensis TaxID=427072 RepID=UPI0003F590DC|nr:polyphosphate polymerase domain-containing protein [Alkalicoccus chagannorensis]
MALEIFSRREIKYLIPYSVYKKLADQLTPYMRYDKFGDGFGRYNIVSLYFDSDDRDIYYETRNKLNFRQKLRLRVYDQADLNSTSFLEVKQKFNNVVNKRRTQLPLSHAYQYLDNGMSPGIDVSNPQIMREADHFRRLYDLKPEVVVSYDRQAFHGIYEDDLRVTFDYNLMCRRSDLRIENGPQGTHFVDEDLVVMEVKINNSVPLWLTEMLSDFRLSKQGVSKFCTSIDVCDQGLDHRIAQ